MATAKDLKIAPISAQTAKGGCFAGIIQEKSSIIQNYISVLF